MKNHKTISEYLKERFKGKTAKICIDGGFSCPNRENGNTGCLFCSESGGSGYYGTGGLSVREQIAEGRRLMDKKWCNKAYIAYFQNFTNTYGSKDRLRKTYNEALEVDYIKGLAIATRPDCIDIETADLLKEIRDRTFLWIELGFQTSNEKTADLINRGYSNRKFTECCNLLKEKNIKFVVHVIAGLPDENKTDFLNTVRYLNLIKPWGIKFHSIYIQNDSPLKEYAEKTGFEPLEMYEYIDWVTDALMVLDENIVIHRLTGDPNRKKLIKPMWQKDKLRVLSEIKRIYDEKSTSI